MAVLLFASSADAVTPGSAPSVVLPGVAATATIEPADPLYFINLSHGLQPAVNADVLRAPRGETRIVLSGFRNRSVKVIHYTAPLRVAQNDMVITLDAPGAGRAIVSLELEF